ncbi:hypothetical protein [Amycolatopsis pittospori]|uniref:hypothetical protein n=1 Tax=Amycolatopsis pittospori TaxID=2749434 RepID=UPI0015F0CA16|nr:hypothetical protein [Amycolatopsis pittospori]
MTATQSLRARTSVRRRLAFVDDQTRFVGGDIAGVSVDVAAIELTGQQVIQLPGRS